MSRVPMLFGIVLVSLATLSIRTPADAQPYFPPGTGVGWSAAPWFSKETTQNFRDIKSSFREMKESVRGVNDSVSDLKKTLGVKPREPGQPSRLERFAKYLKRTNANLDAWREEQKTSPETARKKSYWSMFRKQKDAGPEAAPASASGSGGAAPRAGSGSGADPTPSEQAAAARATGDASGSVPTTSDGAAAPTPQTEGAPVPTLQE